MASVRCLVVFLICFLNSKVTHQNPVANDDDMLLSVSPLDPNSEEDSVKEHAHDHDDEAAAEMSDITFAWTCVNLPNLDHYELNFELMRVIPHEDKLSMHFHSQQNNQLLSSLHDPDDNVEKTRIFLIKALNADACTYSTDTLEPNAFYRVEVAAIAMDGRILLRSKFVTFRTVNRALCYDEMTVEIVLAVLVIVAVWTASMIALMRNWGYLHLTKHAMHTTKFYRPKNLEQVKIVKHQCDSVIYRPSISLSNRGRRISAPAAIFNAISISRPLTTSTSVVSPSPKSVTSISQQPNLLKSLSSGGQSSFPQQRDCVSHLPSQCRMPVCCCNAEGRQPSAPHE